MKEVDEYRRAFEAYQQSREEFDHLAGLAREADDQSEVLGVALEKARANLLAAAKQAPAHSHE
jgi:hypothetical protein